MRSANSTASASSARGKSTATSTSLRGPKPPPRGRSVQQMRAAALLEQWAERNRRVQSDESLRKIAATKMRFQSNQGRRLHGRHATFLRAGSCRRPAPGTAMRGGERMNLAG